MTAWLSSDLALLDARCPLPLALPFTAAQAEALGVSRRRLRTLLARGLVRRVLQGVYAVAQAPDDIAFRAQALHLVVSPSAVVTDRTAAWLHGVMLLPRSEASRRAPISAYQRPGTRARRDGVLSGERTLRADDVVDVHGLRVTSPLRTGLDLGRMLWRPDALAALDQFLALGVSRGELLAGVGRFRGYRGVVQLRGLIGLADPRAESVAESVLRLHWYDAGLPAPELQWWVADSDEVAVYRLDLALPELRYAAEYDGEAFHGPDRTAYDAARRGWLADRGWVVDVFTKADVFVPRADPGRRLQDGVLRARRALVRPTAYPTPDQT
ncbi:type IV toxin-antitoxin system AbiEi family antitoxin domain-containing protein [Nocardioides pantholopis]|uniref:type IV toxin-antitoxin system AbiEi family antitoxin domain-containing protein n=1 Tax=Nocardioides pantholopis TaxID=2483798 RepID=UPI000FD79C4D|nr:type IV toxin-antitoxin system AbiEi family antitoxin domain-containing protein [Nocardioides pantholopis]